MPENVISALMNLIIWFPSSETRTAIMVPTILLETFEDKSDEAKVIDSFRYLSPYRVQARWYELCSLALKKNCHANAKFI